MKFQEISTRTKPTVLVTKETEAFYLHSKYDPVFEAEKWFEGIDPQKLKRAIQVVLGIGVGHHIRVMLKELPHIKKIIIFDFNDHFTDWILKSGLVDDLISDERVEYRSIKEQRDLEYFALTINKDMIIYQPALKIFSRIFLKIRNKLENYIIQERTIIDQNEDFQKNFDLNLKQNDKGIGEYVKPQQDSMILVSAGPSLTKQLDYLQDASKSNKHCIGAVGTAYKPLVKKGIIPDFVMISDPSDLIQEQFEGCNTLQTSLFYLSTANHGAVSSFKGQRYIVWQEGYNRAEDQAILRNEPLIQTGGSVATCLLDLMIFLGARRIALIGQDLAYTNNKSHANFTHASREISDLAFLRKVPNFYQDGFVHTPKNLSIYLEWFEVYIGNKEDIEFWNCTEGGAYIQGWNHESFEKFLGWD
ncbi:motility associated factor glycosyltransferase family protein [Rossellomorea sp. LjRoot5]|uniref:motility associated factor glycosyltransferase family protein n=1 Tax=Rossellomorea sp. LjRoot5 TaxID=3342331 RepID=UPI003ED01817